MGKDANELAMRDPAAAALFGVIGTDFGHEHGRSTYEPELIVGAAEFGGDFGDDEYDGGFTDIGADFGTEFGIDYGFDSAAFGADPAPHAAAPAHAAAHAAHHGATPQGRAIIAHHMKQMAHREKRAMLLEPNKGSDLKVERYTFSINATITALGTGGALAGSNSPDVNFRPQRVTANVVSPGMVLITDIRVANVSFSVGGMIDAWQFNANAVGQHLDVPTLTPANKATFSGSYSGLVPSPLSGTGAYPFVLSFSGPASIVA
jgi:hypothetical protein